MVRGLDQIHGLGDETAHRLALHAMDLTAIVLAAALARAPSSSGLDALPRPGLQADPGPGSASCA